MMTGLEEVPVSARYALHTCRGFEAVLTFQFNTQFKVQPQWCPSLDSCPTFEDARTINPVADSQKASPGYFSIGLANNIVTEVTVTQHAALHRFTFTNLSTTTSPVLLFDLTNDLSHSFGGNGTISFSKFGGTLRAQGGGQYSPSFGVGTYMVNPVMISLAVS